MEGGRTRVAMTVCVPPETAARPDFETKIQHYYELTHAQVVLSEAEKTQSVTLLYKALTRGRYADFLEAVELARPDTPSLGPYYGFQYEYDYGYEYGEENGKIPVGMFGQQVEYDRFACPQLKATVTKLVQNRRDHSARICLAEFLRLSGFDDYWLDDPASADQLGGAKSQFPGEPYSRLETYKQLIAERSTPANIRAYALYRAVWCYGPSGNNSCGGTEVPASQRASWFRRLKRSYPNSRWAKQLKYYW